MAEPIKASQTRLIRINEVVRKTGKPPSGIYAAIEEGGFPPPVKISHRCSAWPENEVDDWIAKRIAERNSRLGCVSAEEAFK